MHAIRDQRPGRNFDRAAEFKSKSVRRRRCGAGFTLVEMLVVAGIMLVLATMTITTLNVTFDAERIRSASRQVHSYIEGSRDRAIYARDLRGVRFIFDATNQQPGSRAIRSLVFVGAPERSKGQLYYNSATGAFVQHPGDFPRWEDYRIRGLLKSGARIQIPAGTGLWYTIQSFGSEDRDLNGTLTAVEDTDGVPTIGSALYLVEGSRFSPGTGAIGNTEFSYEMELRPAVLANQDPVELPTGISIDLDHSQLPAEWRLGGTYSEEMDVMFSPRGIVTGSVAGTGLIHFLLADSEDTIRGLAPPGDESGINPDRQSLGEWRIVTLNTRTGHVSTHEIARDDTLDNSNGDPGADGLADDPFRYAETGEVAP
jgi:type II secretory pathway pseudopilin PulG